MSQMTQILDESKTGANESDEPLKKAPCIFSNTGALICLFVSVVFY